jgi:hypothetical protein
VVGRHDLRPPWELHSRQPGRDNANRPVATANNDYRVGHVRTDDDCTSYDSNNCDGRANHDHRAGYDQVVTDTHPYTNSDADANADDSITDTDTHPYTNSDADADDSITDTDNDCGTRMFRYYCHPNVRHSGCYQRQSKRHCVLFRSWHL